MWRYQLDNYVGSAVLELDEHAALLSYEEYHPFGTTAYQARDTIAEVSLKRYRFIGKERDIETGFYYCSARHYCAWLGRWVSADPQGVDGGLNLYVYSKDNPVMLRDPGGREPGDNKEPAKQKPIGPPTAEEAAAEAGAAADAGAAAEQQSPVAPTVENVANAEAEAKAEADAEGGTCGGEPQVCEAPPPPPPPPKPAPRKLRPWSKTDQTIRLISAAERRGFPVPDFVKDSLLKDAAYDDGFSGPGLVTIGPHNAVTEAEKHGAQMFYMPSYYNEAINGAWLQGAIDARRSISIVRSDLSCGYPEHEGTVFPAKCRRWIGGRTRAIPISASTRSSPGRTTRRRRTRAKALVWSSVLNGLLIRAA